MPGKRVELCVKGPTLTSGHFRNAAASTELFDAEGWLRGGDLVDVDKHRWLRLDGRSKELIRVRGFQVSTIEIVPAWLTWRTLGGTERYSELLLWSTLLRRSHSRISRVGSGLG